MLRFAARRLWQQQQQGPLQQAACLQQLRLLNVHEYQVRARVVKL